MCCERCSYIPGIKKIKIIQCPRLESCPRDLCLSLSIMSTQLRIPETPRTSQQNCTGRLNKGNLLYAKKHKPLGQLKKKIAVWLYINKVFRLPKTLFIQGVRFHCTGLYNKNKHLGWRKFWEVETPPYTASQVVQYATQDFNLRIHNNLPK